MSYRVRKLVALYRDGARAAAASVLAMVRSRIYAVEEHIVLHRALDGTPAALGGADLVVRPR